MENMKKKSGAKCATKCAVKHCPNKYICSDKLSYFKLPKDAERREIWFENCFPGVENKNLIPPFSRICGDHFENKMFLNINRRNRLTFFAVPTLFSSTILAGREKDKIINEDQSNSKISISTYWSLAVPGSNSNSVNTNSNSLICTSDSSCQTTLDLSRTLPRQIKLESELKKARQEIKELGATISKLNNLLAQNYTVENFLKLSEQFLTPNLLVIIKSYLMSKERKKKGYRHSEEIKKFASTLYSMSPSAYNFLRTTFALPNKVTIKRSKSKQSAQSKC